MLSGRRRERANEKREDTLAETLKIVAAIEEEARATGRHLDTKTGSLIGLAAVVLTLNATLGRPILTSDLACPWNSIATVSFFVSIAFLVVAIGTAMFGVLVPKQQQSVELTFIKQLATDYTLDQPPSIVRRAWLDAQTTIAVSDREANRSRVKWMRISSVALGVGLLGVAGQAVTLGITA